MTNKKTRRALLSSVLSLVLCCSMLIGTTFAWFTDSVTSTGNIIKSGTLDVEMSWSNTKDGEYEDASKGAIFNYKFWEPGYVDIKYIKLENVGDLAFKYQLTVNPAISNADGNKLAEVIDVYAAIVEDGFSVDRSNFATKMVKLDTLKNLIGENLADDGVLLPAIGKGSNDVEVPSGTEAYTGEVTVCLALKMQEEAGNEYQNLSIGEGFAVQLIATQFTYENDSFDNTYDSTADNSPNDAKPQALVKYAADKVGVPLPANASIPAFSVGGEILDTGYTFTAPETAEEAELSKYATWHADFVVSFDRDVKNSDKLALAGEYGTWGWLGAYAVDDTEDDDFVIIPAGTSVRLLQLLLGDDTSMNYEGLCSDVVNFTCGAWAKGNLEPLTMTVELRLFEAPSEGTTAPVWVETGKSILIGKYTHTFDVEIDTAEKLQAALNTGKEVKLTQDLDLADAQLTIAAGTTATLNLNGYDLTGAYTGDGHYAMFTVQNGAKLTVKGAGEVTAATEFAESNRSGAIFMNAGELVIDGGEYTLDDSTTGKSWIIATIVDNRTNSTTCATKLTINGGEFSVTGKAKNLFRNYPQQGGTASLTINAGTFNANAGEATTYIWNQESGSYVGTMTFNGGTYVGNVVYEDYNGQTDIFVSDSAVAGGLKACADNT